MSEERPVSRRDELEALLPFYLNGTLDGAELAEVEEWLANDPAAMAALEEAERRILRDQRRQRGDPPAGRCAVALLESAGARGRAGAGCRAARRGWRIAWQRLVGMPAGLAWATAAVAVLLLAAQAVRDFGWAIRAGVEIAGTEDQKLPFALVVFKPDATHG